MYQKEIQSKMKTKLFKPLLACAIVLAIVGAIFAYIRYAAPTRIAFVGYPEYMIAQSLDQQIDPETQVDVVKWTEKSGAELRHYDAMIFFGMGLKFTPEQEVMIKSLKAPLYVTASTRPETKLDTFTPEQSKQVQAYLGGGQANFKELLRYLRYTVDGKRINAIAPKAPIKIEHKPFFHVKDQDQFANYDDYMDFYKKSGRYNASHPTVCILSGNGGGALEMLIDAFEKRNFNVIGTSLFGSFLEEMQKIKPDLLIYQPHGRIGRGDPDKTYELLKTLNVPLLCPIKVGQPYDEYLKDQRGMTGGMLSQSITMPELDGGIVPYVLSALYKNKRGLYVYKMIPERLERFTEMAVKLVALKRKANFDKRIGIIYYKGPGKNSTEAGSIEVGDSMLNTLRYLKEQGYDTGDLPKSVAALQEQIQQNGANFNTYAAGARERFVKEASIQTISPDTFAKWVKKAMPDDLYDEVRKQYGDFPGQYYDDGQGNLALSQLRFGKIVLMPQSAAGIGSDDNKIVHGVKMAPPHHYITTYLYLQNNVDAIIHFGTHGSLEFTPWKQVALSSYDWPDVLIGSLPHFYLYVCNNIGEAIIAKRRSYATMMTHLTPPFMRADGYGELNQLDEKIHFYASCENSELKAEYEKSIIAVAKAEKYDVDLKLSDDFQKGTLTPEDFTRLHDFIHEIKLSKVNRGLYVIGRPYTQEEAQETAGLMLVDVIADQLFKNDLTAGKVREEQRDQAGFFEHRYRAAAQKRITDIFANPDRYRDGKLSVRPAETKPVKPHKMPTATMSKKKHPSAVPANIPAAMKKMMAARQAPQAPKPQPTIEQQTLKAKDDLLISTPLELKTIANALNGGYIIPTSGGDPIGNPACVPTGKNMYGIDPERTPTKESFALGKKLAKQLIQAKIKATGNFPKKVAFSLWGGEFIRTQGSDIGEIFYLLGCEPIWDMRGTVNDVRLIPIDQLKRPRIDVIVQTSGQFRGVATSRMRLIDKAVKLAATDPDTPDANNYVKEGSSIIAKSLIKAGLTPEKAKALADARLFGGVGGNYGTNAQGMIQSGGKWDDPDIIGELYLNNMGALYTDDHWGEFVPGAFRAAVQNTDTIVQSISSNSWGTLSLDHVYEFTGGLSRAIKTATGKDPDAYFNNMRTPGRAKVQEAGEAIMIEARASVLNPKYLKEMMQEGPGGASHFAAVFQNTFGWEVTKPDLLDQHLWDEYKNVFIDDEHKLGMQEYFNKKNPYAYQEMTGVMLESVRKGYWQPNEQTINKIANIHAELVRKHGAGCSGFVCDNPKLRKMIEAAIKDPQTKADYQKAIKEVLGTTKKPKSQKDKDVKGQVLKEQKITPDQVTNKNEKAIYVIGGLVLLAILLVLTGTRRSRAK